MEDAGGGFDAVGLVAGEADDFCAEEGTDVCGDALALKHGDDVVGGAVAEELAEGFFVEGDGVLLDEGDEVLRGVAAEGGFWRSGGWRRGSFRRGCGGW